MLNQDKELVKNAQKDPVAFGALFDQFYEQIFRYVLKRTAHVQAAQDITSEVFFKAYKKLWQFRWQGKPFSAWLYKIATNEVNRYFENGKRAPIPTAFIEELEHLAVTAASPETEFILQQDEFAKRDDLRTLYELVRHLPVKYQEVLALKYFEEKSILEICAILGKKEGTVKSLLSRGIGLLEKKMQPNNSSKVIPVEELKSVGAISRSERGMQHKNLN